MFERVESVGNLSVTDTGLDNLTAFGSVREARALYPSLCVDWRGARFAVGPRV